MRTHTVYAWTIDKMKSHLTVLYTSQSFDEHRNKPSAYVKKHLSAKSGSILNPCSDVHGGNVGQCYYFHLKVEQCFSLYFIFSTEILICTAQSFWRIFFQWHHSSASSKLWWVDCGLPGCEWLDVFVFFFSLFQISASRWVTLLQFSESTPVKTCDT